MVCDTGVDSDKFSSSQYGASAAVLSTLNVLEVFTNDTIYVVVPLVSYNFCCILVLLNEA